MILWPCEWWTRSKDVFPQLIIKEDKRVFISPSLLRLSIWLWTSSRHGGTARQSDMEQADRVHPGWHRLCRGSGEHLEVSLSLLQERRRWDALLMLPLGHEVEWQSAFSVHAFDAVLIRNCWQVPFWCRTSWCSLCWASPCSTWSWLWVSTPGGGPCMPWLSYAHCLKVLCGISGTFPPSQPCPNGQKRPELTFWSLLCVPSGVGMASVAISFIMCTYYNLVITWALYYLFSSFQAPLPWQHCNNTWNTPHCTNHATNGTTNSSTASQEFFKYV